jgi:uncharacterized membrane protein YgdD (TMEM256/DUF423 family)
MHDLERLAPAAPLGGMDQVVAWIVLAWVAWRQRSGAAGG